MESSLSKLITTLILLSASSSTLALDMIPPSIDFDAITSGKDIKFNVWSRAGELTLKELHPTVLAFTSKEIRERFLSNPISHADRFDPITQANYRELVVFTLLYEPYKHSPGEPSLCDNSWHYYLTAELAPRGKRFAISKLIISESGEILFGSNTSPYKWSDTSCPIQE